MIILLKKKTHTKRTKNNMPFNLLKSPEWQSSNFETMLFSSLMASRLASTDARRSSESSTGDAVRVGLMDTRKLGSRRGFWMVCWGARGLSSGP